MLWSQQGSKTRKTTEAQNYRRPSSSARCRKRRSTQRVQTTPTGGTEDQRIRGSDNLTRISFSRLCMRLTCRFPLMFDLQISPAYRPLSKATGRRPIPHREPTPSRLRHRLDLPNRCAACVQYHESQTAYYSHSTRFFTRSFTPCVCM